MIYIIDDDLAVLESLQRLLRAAGHAAQQYSSAEAFLAADDPSEPGCAVVDLGLPGIDGFAIQQAVSRPVIFLTGIGDVPSSVRAMKAGAIDFLTKPVDSADLLSAVLRALAHDTHTREVLRQRELALRRLGTLTPREREVLERVVEGRLNKQIACELGAAEKTVKVHRGRMMRKMGVRTVPELIRLCDFDRAQTRVRVGP